MYRRGQENSEEGGAGIGHSHSCGGPNALQMPPNRNYGTNYDFFAVLNPILDASHTRNLRTSPPYSECLKGTREDFIAKALSWARARPDDSENIAHVLWIYGYAGCGKSAMSLAVAQQLAKDGLLVASFFFFRGAGDRSGVRRFIGTMVYQMVAAVPETSGFVEAAFRGSPRLLSSVDLCTQFTELVFKPILAVAKSLDKSLTIVLDGVDECQDRKEVEHFIEGLIDLFNRNPLAPLRIIISSRVEHNLHRLLHSSNQVQLLDLVEHASDADIEAALESRLKEERRRVLGFSESWPSKEEKRKLVRHVDKSFIFLTTILNELFKPVTSDGLKPIDRLPNLLSLTPNFDGLYISILRRSSLVPHFPDVVSTIALVGEALSIAQIADLNEISIPQVVDVLADLRAIIQVPGDDQSPVTLWHTSLRDFLCSKERAGAFFAPPTHHRRIAHTSVRIATCSSVTSSPALGYSRRFGVGHLMTYLYTEGDQAALYNSFLEEISPDLIEADFDGSETVLEVACLWPNWRLVDALVKLGANVNARFAASAPNSFRVPLHAACYHGAKGTIDLLLDNGADPNVVSDYSGHSNKNHDVHATIGGSLQNIRQYGAGWGYCAFPLAWACAERDIDLVRKLLKHGANPNLRGGAKGTALRHAAPGLGNESTEIVRVLLEHGADPNLTLDKIWSTPPLHAACELGRPETTRLLLDHEADPNIKTNQGETALHAACRNKKSSSLAHVECLLRHGADPNVDNRSGNTPLHVAYSEGKLGVAEYLLKHKANPNIKNNRELTPAQCARQRG